MPSWADLNERQQQYLQAIYETDQEQEALKSRPAGVKDENGYYGHIGWNT